MVTTPDPVEISEQHTNVAIDNPRPVTCPVVGVGASAGGIEALTKFVANLPAHTGMAYVLILHLDRSYPSLMTVILSKVTSLPVVEATDQMEVLPNKIYVIAPNTGIEIEGERLRVRPRDPTARPNFPIDTFFRSLAKHSPARAIGVVLSGTGTDGTLGLLAMRSAGCITYAQDDTAQFTAMPRSAISSGSINFVLPPKQIAASIADIGERDFPEVNETVQPPAPVDDDEGDIPLPSDDEDYFASIMETLYTNKNIDFSNYRPTTIKRRIIRRMHLTSQPTMAAYARYLADHASEMPLLLKDLLINVTSFYRDKSLFHALHKSMLPSLLKDRPQNAALRIWVVGCATGQEVYSLAIEMIEFIKDMPHRPQVQIFATDISEPALAKARSGIYPSSITSEVPSDRLERYFNKEENGYRIGKEIRQLCVFAKHDVTRETPFSKLDLICCRNVLIYFEQVLLTKVISTFHYALKAEGYLLLGSTESVERSSNQFSIVDDINRIYHKNSTPVLIDPLARIPSSPHVPNKTDRPFPRQSSSLINHLQQRTDRILLNRYAPASVVVNDSMEIVQYNGHTTPYLEPASGEASNDIFTKVPFGVGQALRTALAEAKQHRVPIRREGIVHRRDNTLREIAFEVIPIVVTGLDEEFFLILFEEHDPSQAELAARNASTPHGVHMLASNESRQLCLELEATTDSLRTLVKEKDLLSDQLKSLQEELMSTTEEFHSTHEELLTSKEELESANEELHTVNEELRRSFQSIESSRADLMVAANLTNAIIENMGVPVLLLDADLRVLKVNPAFLEAFGVTADETLGRKIFALGNRHWDIPKLRELLKDLLPKRSEITNFEVTHDFEKIGQRTMLLNARHLRGSDDTLLRIVVSINDITEHRNAETLKHISDDLRRSNAELDEFAAVAAHDLQEPLRMVSTYISLIEHRCAAALDDKGREHLRLALLSSKRMSALIHDVLSYSRLGHQNTALAPIEITKPLQTALINLTNKIEAAKATITEGPLPQVKANADQITRLFQNLISNAIKFRSAKRPLTVNIYATESASEWTISVADNGIGMDLKQGGGEKIFQLFQRLNSADKFPGTGIGLATCKKIIQQHGGRIWVESLPDIGSTFNFTLPKRP